MDELVVTAPPALRMPQRIAGLSRSKIEAAEFPALYLAARVALQECELIDEVKDIDDKWAALAMYAKQTQDPELEQLARRIALRAERRMGELLKEIPRARGSRRDQKGMGPHGAAAAAGLTREMTRRALAFASVPAGEFEAMLSGVEVPTRTEYSRCLTGLARTSKPPRNSGALDQRRAALDALRHFNTFWASHPPAYVATAFKTPDQHDAAVRLVERIETALRTFKAKSVEPAAAVEKLVNSISGYVRAFQARPATPCVSDPAVLLITNIETQLTAFRESLGILS